MADQLHPKPQRRSQEESSKEEDQGTAQTRPQDQQDADLRGK
jgi:hypothetical protein